MTKQYFGVYLPQELYEWIAARAEAQKTTLSWVVRDILWKEAEHAQEGRDSHEG